jgi:hypothetical protein
VLLRLSPLLPLALSNYLYGLTSVDLGSYVFGSWAGMLPGTIAYVAAGACASERKNTLVSLEAQLGLTTLLWRRALEHLTRDQCRGHCFTMTCKPQYLERHPDCLLCMCMQAAMGVLCWMARARA